MTTGINVADSNALLDLLFGAGSNTVAPATYHLGLSTTDIAADGTGATEPSGNGYARVAITNGTTNFPAASTRVKSNGTVLTFPTATGSWGTPVAFGFWDASTGGSPRSWGTIGSPVAINSGGVASVAVGALTVDVVVA